MNALSMNERFRIPINRATPSTKLVFSTITVSDISSNEAGNWWQQNRYVEHHPRPFSSSSSPRSLLTPSIPRLYWKTFHLWISLHFTVTDISEGKTLDSFRLFFFFQIAGTLTADFSQVRMLIVESCLGCKETLCNENSFFFNVSFVV